MKVTDEMIAAFERDGTGGYGDVTDVRRGLAAVLDLIERDHEVLPYCNDELMPGVVCKLGAQLGHRKHRATIAPGRKIEWEATP